LKIDSRSRIEGDKILSLMKLESISVAGKDANQSGVGKKFLVISISLTVLLNLSIAIWFFMNDMSRFLVK
tara:strand:+ start:245 stop:454 length:210 start_codon:yes stop_codon:yes gene_type:complete